ncbi:Mrp/NBP35 family ATP-binding protein [Roseimarinus sediminis]|uniref:Mrp/NBP35 family ATP-binding protein n=1 Tax=Roseimarinus sediminis TaxID=1610899 RepID=UPI003D19C3C6
MDKKAIEKVALPSVKNIIVVASGKGGVGKSTVSANLSVALARQGYRVALVDTDLYGPSIPLMFGVEGRKLESKEVDGKQRIVPFERYGVKLVSIGFFLSKQQSLVWRGPLVSKVVTQLFEDTLWGDIDYMIVDFPPGTGDIQLTTVQKMNLSGAIIVTTPQQVAVADARKAADMFLSAHIGVPVLGIVENMAWFIPAQHPDEQYYIFGKGGGLNLAHELSVPLIGQIPFIMEIGEKADHGLTVYNQQNKAAIDAFDSILTYITHETATI